MRIPSGSVPDGTRVSRVSTTRSAVHGLVTSWSYLLVKSWISGERLQCGHSMDSLLALVIQSYFVLAGRIAVHVHR